MSVALMADIFGITIRDPPEGWACLEALVLGKAINTEGRVVMFIRTTPEKLWNALMEPETTRKFWMGTHLESDWKKGAAWKMIQADGRLTDAGEIVEIVPLQKLVLSWRHEHVPELKAEGVSRMTLEIESAGDTVKLTVVHEIDFPQSKLIKAVSGGWPKILSSLKSLLETGEPIEDVRHWAKGCPGSQK